MTESSKINETKSNWKYFFKIYQIFIAINNQIIVLIINVINE